MRRIVIGPRAREDARGIWHYTNTEHGPEVAGAYILDLDRALQRIREFPDMGSDCSDVRRNYWRIRTGTHLIYYISSKTALYVVRSLHERQNPPKNLR